MSRSARRGRKKGIRKTRRGPNIGQTKEGGFLGGKTMMIMQRLIVGSGQLPVPRGRHLASKKPTSYVSDSYSSHRLPSLSLSALRGSKYAPRPAMLALSSLTAPCSPTAPREDDPFQTRTRPLGYEYYLYRTPYSRQTTRIKAGALCRAQRRAGLWLPGCLLPVACCLMVSYDYVIVSLRRSCRDLGKEPLAPAATWC